MATEHMPKVPSPTVCTVNMTQSCKVCGEPAAGFHFGAFTCEGCKSFFGRTYNNLSSLNECKSSGRCVINKKTRTSCKSCRLRKCLMVGMSKSGSRYGRRSNWFKIHYLMQSNSNSNSADGTTQNEEGATRIPTSPSATATPTTIVDTWDDSSPLPATLRVSPNDSFKCLGRRSGGFETDINLNLKRSQDHKMAERIRLGTVDLPFNLEVKELSSPTSSSADSPSSESPKDSSGDQTLFAGGGAYSENFYPKDLLSLYNIPSFGSRIPPYLSSPVITQRFLYPYYPNIFSLYSRRQYLDTLIKEASNSETSSHPKSTPPSLSDDEDANNPPNDYQPPLKMIKSSSSPPSLYPIQPVEDPQIPWLKKEPPVIISPPASCPSLVLEESRPLLHSRPENKSNAESKTVAHDQEAPIDLSIRSARVTTDEDKVSNASLDASPKAGYRSSTEERDSSPIKSKERMAEKEDQKNPLDLSGFKT